METVAFEVERRSELGKNKVKQLGDGIIPAVVYGSSKESIPVSVNRNELIKLYNRQEKGRNTILELKINGEKSETLKVIAYQLDYHPVKRQLTHIDFLVVEDNVPVKILVPCNLEGTAKGQKMAGVLIHNLKVLKLSCLPAEIPTSYNVDITELGIGQNVRVSDLKAEGSISFLNDPYDIILQIDAPRVDKSLLSSAVAVGDAGEEAEDGEAAEGGESAGDADASSEEGGE